MKFINEKTTEEFSLRDSTDYEVLYDSDYDIYSLLVDRVLFTTLTKDQATTLEKTMKSPAKDDYVRTTGDVHFGESTNKTLLVDPSILDKLKSKITVSKVKELTNVAQRLLDTDEDFYDKIDPKCENSIKYEDLTIKLYNDELLNGEFNSDDNTIRIWADTFEYLTAEDIIGTLVHEYAHYVMHNEFGFDSKHIDDDEEYLLDRAEVCANAFECLYSGNYDRTESIYAAYSYINKEDSFNKIIIYLEK